MCADTELIPSWEVCDRGAGTARELMQDLASRLASRVQLTTDRHRVYLNAVESAFGSEIDYAMLVKIYGSDRGQGDVRYSPADYIGCRQTRLNGLPNPKYISTGFAELQSLTMRMKTRRFTRLTNAFSKKLDNHRCAVALHFMHYNFCCVRQTLRVTPAMEAGIAEHVWTIEEIVELLNPAKTVANAA
jgi:IS1 family transposase